jgi:hypothetical protein
MRERAEAQASSSRYRAPDVVFDEDDDNDPGNHDPDIEPESPDDSGDDGEDGDPGADPLEGEEDPERALEEATKLERSQQKIDLTKKLVMSIARLTNEYEFKRRQKTRDKQKKNGRKHYPYTPIVSHRSMAERLAQKAYIESNGKKTSHAERAQVAGLVLTALHKSNTALPVDAQAIAELLKTLHITEKQAIKLKPKNFFVLFQRKYSKLKGVAKNKANYYIHYLHTNLKLVPTGAQDGLSQL